MIVEHDRDYDPISFTARKVLQARARYTSIPLAGEMAAAAGVGVLGGVRDRIRQLIWGDARRGLYLQLRYQAISHALSAYPGSAVLELAAGYSTRGVIERATREAYIESDLRRLLEAKRQLVASMKGGSVGANHHFLALNVCDDGAMRQAGDCVGRLHLTLPVVVIHEGLLMYLTSDEQARARDNIAWFLRTCANGGAWITTDFSERCQDISLVQRLMSRRLARQVKRSMNYFADDESVERFLSQADLRFEKLESLERDNADAEVRKLGEGFRAWRITT
jgi:O-methyltransferase involved in polyketide biosynthesis